MTGYVSYLSTQKENQILFREVQRNAARSTDEQWDYFLSESMDAAARQISENPMVQLISWDVTSKGACEYLEQVRKNFKEPLLLIVADETISPLLYLKTSIAPGALLLKPVGDLKTGQILEEVFEELARRLYKNDRDTVFTAESRAGKIRVPMEQIDYFESREKKIFLRSGREEYGFYGTLEELSEQLAKNFLRCHRSFLVNMDQVKVIDFTHNLITLKRGGSVPMSRSCKKTVRGYQNG